MTSLFESLGVENFLYIRLVPNIRVKEYDHINNWLSPMSNPGYHTQARFRRRVSETFYLYLEKVSGMKLRAKSL